MRSITRTESVRARRARLSYAAHRLLASDFPGARVIKIASPTTATAIFAMDGIRHDIDIKLLRSSAAERGLSCSGGLRGCNLVAWEHHGLEALFKLVYFRDHFDGKAAASAALIHQ